MALTDDQLAFVQRNPSAAMITTGESGVPKAVRVGIAVVDGRLWSSGTEARLRTRRLRTDPRCTLFVFESGYGFLTLETTVTVLAGPDAPQQNLALFRTMQGKPTGPLSWFGGELDEPEFLERMVSEGRVVYEFDVRRGYGLTT